MTPAAAQDAIRAGMAAAIRRLGEMRPYEPKLPLEGEVDFRLPGMAAHAAILPGVERAGPRTVTFGAADGDAFFRLFVALFRLAGIPAA
jgi:D-aminopeptidase